SDLFNAGIRPAINVGLSVSRVGSAAQTKVMKSVSGRLKGEMSQYRELQAFAQFGTSDLDASTRRQLERGQRATELLKQPQFAPLSMSEEVVVLFALSNGMMDDIEVSRIQPFEAEIRKFLASNHPDLLNDIAERGVLDDDLSTRIRSVIETFKQTVPF
ncbi:MAG: F0F1 ATP synthase subunit alpha, partial [Dehalococcoidia bacterium]|nr:F0F1 ATP synthase subunit alpha [Dehalococcoidia bacterium]